MGYSLSDALNRPRAGGRQGQAVRPPVVEGIAPRRAGGRSGERQRRKPQAARSSSPATAASASPPPIIVRPTAQRRLSTGRYSLEGARESWEAERPERQARTLRMLRAAFAEGEEALVGWAAITLFLHRHGV